MKNIAILTVLLLLSIKVTTALTVSKVQNNTGITWSLQKNNFTAKAGDTIKVVLTGLNDNGRHIYGIKEHLNKEGVGPQKTEITLDNSNLFLLSSKIVSTKPKVVFDSGFEIKLDYYYGKVDFTLPIVINKSITKKSLSCNVLVYFQSCDEHTCKNPVEIKVPFTVNIVASDDSKSSGQNDTPVIDEQNTTIKSNKNTTDNASSNVMAATATKEASIKPDPVKTTDAIPASLWEAILWSIAAGFAAWFMPCVYPMIPITVSFFTKRSEKEHTNPIKDSIVYSLGIMSTYVILGVGIIIFLQFLGGGSDSASEGRNLATNPVLNMFLAILFLVIAGNLFGMYEIALPSRFVNALNKKSNQKSGYSASFIMGMVFSLTSLTCTIAPISAIQSVATQGELLRPLYTMTILSAVFALPFFLLALFPTAINKMPRSGGWMNNIKVFFGFIEIAFAVSYFARVDSILGWEFVSREFVLASWAGCSILILLYMLGVFKMKLDNAYEHIGGIRVFLAVIFAGVSVYLFNGMSGKSIGELEPFVYVESTNVNSAVVSQPNETATTILSSTHTPGSWTESLEVGFQIAKKENKAIFLDFTGVSCTNCRLMEKNMFPRPRIKELMDKLILVRCYTDRRYNPQDQKYQAMQLTRFQSTELPLYVIITPDDKVIDVASFTKDENAFVSFLQKGTSL